MTGAARTGLVFSWAPSPLAPGTKISPRARVSTEEFPNAAKTNPDRRGPRQRRLEGAPAADPGSRRPPVPVVRSTGHPRRPHHTPLARWAERPGESAGRLRDLQSLDVQVAGQLGRVGAAGVRRGQRGGAAAADREPAGAQRPVYVPAVLSLQDRRPADASASLVPLTGLVFLGCVLHPRRENELHTQSFFSTQCVFDDSRRGWSTWLEKPQPGSIT